MWNILAEIIDKAIIPTIESITTGMQVLQTPDVLVPSVDSKYYN